MTYLNRKSSIEDAPFAKMIEIEVLEVYEYSIFTETDLTGVVDLTMWGNTHKFKHTSKEIIPSPSGSVIYFNEPVNKDIVCKGTYPTYISNRTKEYWFFHKMHMFLQDYLLFYQVI